VVTCVSRQRKAGKKKNRRLRVNLARKRHGIASWKLRLRAGQHSSAYTLLKNDLSAGEVKLHIAEEKHHEKKI